LPALRILQTKMKSATDPRHKKRIKIIKELFAESYAHQNELSKTAKKILKHKAQIDVKIQDAAPTWPVDKLNKIDLAILRLAIYELESSEVPPKVVIDEAVELAKEYGSENSSSFVNGVLGTIYKEQGVETPEHKKTNEQEKEKNQEPTA
jgi:N utilization substance protein B